MGLRLREASIRDPRLVADGTVLAFAFLVIPRFGTGIWLDPFPAIIGIALGTIFMRGPDSHGPVPWRKQLATQIGVCSGVALIWCWLFRLPLGVLWFAPVWIGLSSAVAWSAKVNWSALWDGQLTVGASHLGALLRRAGACWERIPAAFLVGTAPPVAVYGALAMLVPGFSGLRREALVLALVAWLVVWAAAFSLLRRLNSWWGVVLPLVSATALHLAFVRETQGGLDRMIWVWCGWSTLLVVSYRGLIRSAARSGAAQELSETVRLLLIVGCAALLMKGFLSPNLQGTGDSKWYATMLEDAVLQTRAHGFPVWAGESLYQFNGAIYPLRVAPAFHHLGALLDLATLRSLPPVTLMNLLVFVVGVTSAVTTYYACGIILGERRWAAAAVAIIYLGCPGVLELSYNSDLYMSWMTVPFVPLALFAAAHNAMKPGLASAGVLAAALGLCWWGHSPIALWTTAAVFLIQGAGILINRPSGVSLVIIGVGVALFAAIAAYPLGSVLLYPPEPGASGDWQRASVSIVVSSLRQAFPAVLLPVSRKGLMPGNYQLGYALWAIFLCSLVWVRRIIRGPGIAALTVAAGIVVLLYPFPVIQERLWTLVPAFVLNITGNHVAGRLYLVLASACLVSGAILIRSASSRAYRVALMALLIGAGWSVLEADDFSPSEWDFRNPTGPDTSDAMMRTENVMVTRFAHIIFRKVPTNYSDGVVAPELEYRLLRNGDFSILVDGKGAAAKESRTLGVYDFVPAEDGSPWLEIRERFALSPSSRYMLSLEVDSASVPVTGVLQVKGSSTLREYLLPAMGGDRSFGLGGMHSPYLPIWTSVPGGETIQVRFIPQGMTVEQADHFARVRFGEYDPEKMPVEVSNWMPYQARVRANEACWFETPRDYQVGYVATVDGIATATRKSPDGLVMVPVPQGSSEVVVRFVAPLGLRMLFLLSVLSIAGLLACLAAGKVTGFGS